MGLVKSIAMAHGFLELLGAVDLAILEACDLQPETVGT
jgi:hypothetical protein